MAMFRDSRGTPVEIITNSGDNDIETGRILPCLFRVEKPSSTQLLIDSKDRVNPNDTPFNFTVNLSSTLMRSRSIKVVRVIMPKLPNVTVHNNTMLIKHDLGTTAEFTIPPAFYNPTTLSNALTSEINLAFVAAGIVDTVVTAYDQVTKTFSITSTGGNNFFISSTCTFITRGTYLANFESEPIANVPSKSIIYSGPAGMVYTRYVTLHSETLNMNSFAESVTSSSTRPVEVIAILDTTTMAKPEDYDTTKPYSGIYSSVEAVGAPQISTLSGSREIFRFQHLYMLDEYGLDLQQVMTLGAPYNTNQLGISIYLKVLF